MRPRELEQRAAGRLVAAATRDRFFLSPELENRPAEDPERTFVTFMAACAGDVLTGELPGPYTDQDARRYARAALIPAELLERDPRQLTHASRALRVPIDELHAARAEHLGRVRVL